ncbi:MAG: SusD/RagB family nutrient-binding outer membrane lipoprotein [Prevotellaceae bacterium]|jgi:hypothetical protein|nr:SusD/RagB family nutrient-binding outer membrane lipoprotein [Prevotellaceae bacterium]
MKRKTSIYLFTLILLLSYSCNDYLDINHDPNALEEIPDAKVLLPAAEIGIANNLMGWHFGFSGAFWVEYWTQSYNASQFKSLCEYLPQDFNTAYQSLMSQPLTDLKRIKTLSENSGNKGYYFIAEALSIYVWQIITDLWGDMPYFEALRGDEGIFHPKQDKGIDIYADLERRVDSLLNFDLSEASIDGHYDYIFEGDIESWQFFVCALKLKLMLRLSETSDFDKNKLYDFVMDHEEELYYFGYYGGAKIPNSVWNDGMEGKRHPMREFQAGGANYISLNVIGCKNFVDYLKINNDPRLATLFIDGTLGAFFGDFDSKADSDGNGTKDDKEKYCTSSFAAATPSANQLDLFLFSPWEVYFAIAEVCARAGDNSYAQAYYEYAVEESLGQHGINNLDIFESGYAAWKDGTENEHIEQIAMQRWVANCNYQHIESFIERNRTKYPRVHEINIGENRPYAFANFPVGYLTISVNGRNRLNGNLPASPLYPEYYVFRNTNAPAQKPDVGQKVWWNNNKNK